jgi:hypothetical protein
MVNPEVFMALISPRCTSPGDAGSGRAALPGQKQAVGDCGWLEIINNELRIKKEKQDFRRISK